MQSKILKTQEFMIAHLEAKCSGLIVELKAEKTIVKAMQDYVNEVDDFEMAVLCPL